MIDGTIIISYFNGNNNIFADCTISSAPANFGYASTTNQEIENRFPNTAFQPYQQV